MISEGKLQSAESQYQPWSHPVASPFYCVSDCRRARYRQRPCRRLCRPRRTLGRTCSCLSQSASGGTLWCGPGGGTGPGGSPERPHGNPRHLRTQTPVTLSVSEQRDFVVRSGRGHGSGRKSRERPHGNHRPLRRQTPVTYQGEGAQVGHGHWPQTPGRPAGDIPTDGAHSQFLDRIGRCG